MNDQTTNPEPQRPPRSGRRRIILIISVIVAGVALYYLVPTVIVVYVMQPIRVEGTAMVPTLNNGDRIFVSKRVGTLRRGDIVVFNYPVDTTKSFIKRVIGLPGERIDVDDVGNIVINGQQR